MPPITGSDLSALHRATPRAVIMRRFAIFFYRKRGLAGAALRTHLPCRSPGYSVGL